MSNQHAQSEYRSETKFLLHQKQLDAILPHLNARMVPDPNQHQVDNTISTVYLDSPDRKSWKAVDQGSIPRYKLRVRSYGKVPRGLVNAEIKGRDEDANFKHRAVLDASDVPAFLGGNLGVTKNKREGGAFLLLKSKTNAQPVLATRVERRGWQASKDDDTTRVTIDSNIRTKPMTGADHPNDMSAPWFPVLPPDMHVMETKLKDGAEPPAWMQDLFMRQGISPKGVSKYHLALQKLEGRDLHLHGLDQDQIRQFGKVA